MRYYTNVHVYWIEFGWKLSAALPKRYRNCQCYVQSI